MKKLLLIVLVMGAFGLGAFTALQYASLQDQNNTSYCGDLNGSVKSGLPMEQKKNASPKGIGNPVTQKAGLPTKARATNQIRPDRINPANSLPPSASAFVNAKAGNKDGATTSIETITGIDGIMSDIIEDDIDLKKMNNFLKRAKSLEFFELCVNELCEKFIETRLLDLVEAKEYFFSEYEGLKDQSDDSLPVVVKGTYDFGPKGKMTIRLYPKTNGFNLAIINKDRSFKFKFTKQ